jgi:hypothetical protein
MIDSDDVHQLRAEPEQQLRIRHPSDRDADGSRGSILIVISHRRCDEHDELVRRLLIPTVEEARVRTLGVYETDPVENSYPALPVRHSNVLVWMAAADSADVLDDAAQQISIARRLLAEHAAANGLDEVLLDILRLEPTRRSCLNGADVEGGGDDRRT